MWEYGRTLTRWAIYSALKCCFQKPEARRNPSANAGPASRQLLTEPCAGLSAAVPVEPVLQSL